MPISSESSRSAPAKVSRRPWLETPLDPAKSQIRLLTLHRGRTSDPIVVDLHVVSLDDDSDGGDGSLNNNFETLSYVWGDPTQAEPITVSGVPFDATRNLAEFLRCLRLHNAERVVWADAICIDQTSVAEKSHQIGLMARIYRQAAKAAIWFGHFTEAWPEDIVAALEESGSLEEGQIYVPTSHMTTRMWEGAERYCAAQKEQFVSLGGKLLPQPVEDAADSNDTQDEEALDELLFETLQVFDSLVRGKHLWEFSLLYLDPSNAHCNSGVAMNRNWPRTLDCARWLLSRPWWSRVWTLQEAVLPRADAVVYIGTLPVRFSRIVDGGRAFSDHWLGDCCKRVCNLAAAEYQRFPHRHWLSAQQVHAHRQRFSPPSDRGESSSVAKRRKNPKKDRNRNDEEVPFISIAEAINSTQWRRATDPRDHFFGVLGLLPGAWHTYFQEVGYGCSAGSLFAQCTKLLYVNDGHLRQLGCAVGTRRRAEAVVVPRDLPTWAIDLSRASGHDEDGADRWALYDAYPGSAYDDEASGVRFMHDLQDPVLRVPGIYVGGVAACASRTSNRRSNNIRSETRHEQPAAPPIERDEAQRTLTLVTEWKTLWEAHRHHPHPSDNELSNLEDPDDDTFWRTAFMDRDIWRYWLHKRRPLPTPKLHDIRSWWEAFAATGDYRDLVPDQQPGGVGRGTYHYRALTLNLEKCRLFCSDRGEPGLGPHDVAPGDEVFILAGCRSPAVLRPIPEVSVDGQNRQDTERSDRNEKEASKYQFVGLCFVDGWMYGKAESRQLPWQSLKLY
ncbi:heterokaryon incompatibility protein-domain-containing protein [Apiospora marii]|uniref:heterokaryon incompatibility protein-domain-containing protein n=1 Tax=Apiospora marii TaxID=335849 RepID=UPI0031301EC4